MVIQNGAKLRLKVDNPLVPRSYHVHATLICYTTYRNDFIAPEMVQQGFFGVVQQQHRAQGQQFFVDLEAFSAY